MPGGEKTQRKYPGRNPSFHKNRKRRKKQLRRNIPVFRAFNLTPTTFTSPIQPPPARETESVTHRVRRSKLGNLVSKPQSAHSDLGYGSTQKGNVCPPVSFRQRTV